MAKTSHSQEILSEIELFLSAGRYEDAKVLLNFVDYNATDRATKLYFLLINATIDGALGYQDEIDQVATLPNPTDIEKEIVRKILLLSAKPREEGRRAYQPHARPRDQSFGKVTSPTTRTSQSRQDAEQRRQDESELAEQTEAVLDPEELRYKETIRYLENRLSEKDELLERLDAELQATGSKVDQLTARLTELAVAKEQETGLLRQELGNRSELLQAKDDAIEKLDAQFAARVSTWEIQLDENQSLLENRDAELQSSGSKLDQLTARLTELTDAKEQEGALLREELANRSELLQARNDAINKLQLQFAGQVDALENQLGEKQSLLQNRDADVESLTVRVSELTRQCADLESERETSVRLALEELNEKTALFQSTATAIDELEARSSAIIASFERQLAEKQAIVEQGSAELAELRGQIVFLTEKLAHAEEPQRSDETSPHDERQQANPSIAAEPSPHERAVAAPLRPATPSDVASPRFQDTISDWFSGVRHAWQSTWKPTLPKTALPVAGGVLLIIPIVYLLSGQGRTAAKSEPNVAVTQAPARQTLDIEPSSNGRLPADELKTPQSVITTGQNIRKRDPRPVRAATYVTRRAVPLREYPRYAAAAKTQIQSGTRISVLESQGSWFKVETQPAGAVGYVRKEYLVLAQSSAGQY